MGYKKLKLNVVNRWRLFLIYLYFTVPHNIFNIDGWSIIKPHDIIACLISILLLNKSNYKSPIYLLLFSFWYLIRSLFEINEIGIISLGYGFKFIEYMIIYYALSELKNHQIIQLLRIVTLSIVFYIGLELCGIRMGPYWGGRLSGQFGGPYELGAICMIMLLLKNKNYLEKAILFIALLLSGAKASFLGFISSKIKKNNIFISIGAIIILLLTSLIIERFYDLFESMKLLMNFDLMALTNEIPRTLNQEEYFSNWNLREGFSSKAGIDLSTGSRLYTYILAIKSLNYYQILIGRGPGFYGVSLDSSFIRVFVECGIVGFFLMFLMLKQIFSKISNREITIAVIINMMFVDILFSARFLPLLFAIYIYHRNFFQANEKI